MASIIETKAVALRQGTTEQNDAFTGVLGEITADLGYASEGGNLGTDINTTIRIHNGITQGGIKLARADLRNVSTQQLAEGREYFGDKNVAYCDLSNLGTTDNPIVQANIVDTLSSYGLATDADVNIAVSNLAIKNMSNVDTSDLAVGRGEGVNGNLAYTDTSNINTNYLTNAIIHDGTNNNKPLTFSDQSNANTTYLTLDENDENRPSLMRGPGLATNTLSNLTETTWNSIISTQRLEQSSNKDNIILSNAGDIAVGHYPETLAVKTYVDNKVSAGTSGFLQNDFTNASNYTTLYGNRVSQFVFEPLPENLVSTGTGFVVGTALTNKILMDTTELQIQVGEVSEVTGFPTSATVYPEYGATLLETQTVTIFLAPSGKVSYTLTSTEQTVAGVYRYTLSNQTNSGTATFSTDSLYKLNTPLSIIEAIVINVTEVSSPNGEIVSYYASPQMTFSYVSEEITIYNNGTSETPTDATLLLQTTTNLVPMAGDGKLTKLDFSNLTGMSTEDSINTQDTHWRIRHNEAFPSVIDNTISDIPAHQYTTLAVNGRVWEELSNLKDYVDQEVGGTKANISLDNLSTAGTNVITSLISPATVNKANTDLDNLSATGEAKFKAPALISSDAGNGLTSGTDNKLYINVDVSGKANTDLDNLSTAGQDVIKSFGANETINSLVANGVIVLQSSFSYYRVTLDGNAQFYPNFPTGVARGIVVECVNFGNYTVMFPDIKFKGGVLPEFTPDGKDVMVLMQGLDNIIYGFMCAKDIK